MIASASQAPRRLDDSDPSALDASGLRRMRWTARVMFSAAVSIGMAVLLDRLLGLELLTQPWWSNTKTTTAVCMVLLGVALRVQLACPPYHGRSQLSVVCVALCVAASVSVAGLSLYETAFSEELRVLSWLTPSNDTRMSPVSALNVCLLGLSCLWLHVPPRDRLAPAAMLALLPLFLALGALVGYAYGVRPFQRVAGITPMVALTALGMLMLSLGVVCSRVSPESASLIAGNTVSSQAVRKLLLGLVAIPISLGLFERYLSRHRLYEAEFGIAMLTVASILLLFWLTLGDTRKLLLVQRTRRRLERDLAHKEGLLQAESRLRALTASIEDARHHAQQAVQRSEEKFRALAVHAPVGIFESDARGVCTFVNPRWTEITGSPAEESVGYSWERNIHPEDVERVRQTSRAAAASGTPFLVDYRYLSRQQEVSWVHGASVPLKDSHGVTTGYMGTIVDVTERRRTLDALAKSETNFRSLVEHAPFGVLVLRGDVIVYANATYAQMLGFGGPGELAGRSAMNTLVHPDDLPRVRERMQQRAAGNVTPVATFRCLKKDGSEISLESATTELIFDGEPALVVVALDVTARERAEQVRLSAEQTLRDSLREKEVLLKEVHHRVKNNLQVIVSLINLQAQKIDDRAMRSVFDETRSRVHAIALLHERLYGSKDLGQIDMRDYLCGLASDLSSTNVDQRPITVEVQADDVQFEMDAAVPIGLIVNELVTNSYKHAFPRDRRNGGKITVALTQEEQTLCLTVSDDGIGYPSGVDPDTVDSLGLLLISSLSRQLEGEAVLSQGASGATCSVRFPARVAS